MLSRLARRFPAISLSFSILLVGACGIFAYQVSPLRDPTFQPNSANSGSLVPWLQGVTEGHWLLGATVLAALLATHLTLILYQRNRPLIYSARYGQRRLSRAPRQFLGSLFWPGVWVMLLIGLWFMFLVFLMCQWLVD